MKHVVLSRARVSRHCPETAAGEWIFQLGSGLRVSEDWVGKSGPPTSSLVYTQTGVAPLACCRHSLGGEEGNRQVPQGTSASATEAPGQETQKAKVWGPHPPPTQNSVPGPGHSPQPRPPCAPQLLGGDT